MKKSIQFITVSFVFGLVLSACAGSPVKHSGDGNSQAHDHIERMNRKI